MAQRKQLELAELCDLLVEKTTELLDAMNKKANEQTIMERRKDVEKVQSMIKQKRTEMEKR
jgi:hypothetical protein